MRANRVLLIVLVALLPATTGCISAVAGPSGWGQAWPAQMVGADDLHSRGLTGEGVQVAVIDTGIDAAHPEFRGVPIRWLDLVNGRSSPYDDHGHGTHVAGIIAAQGTWRTWLTGFELKGIAPDVTLIAIKAIDKNGRGDEANVARGINTAISSGADIIVLSLGGGSLPILGTDTERAVQKALEAGVYIVAAAGNSPQDGDGCSVTSPASVEGVIAVGAVDKDGTIGRFSCTGQGDRGAGGLLDTERDPHRKPEVVAPGVDVLSAWADGQYVQATGTSQAAPIVAGLLALVLQNNPALKPSSVEPDAARENLVRVKEALMVSSAKVGPLEGAARNAHDPAYGYGLVDGGALLRALS